MRSQATLFEGIDRFEFGMLRQKLVDQEEGLGWSEEQCTLVEDEYRKYLALTRVYGLKSLVPPQLVDSFWHYHILDTQAYVADCERVFGKYLHHFPYFGLRGAEDVQAL